MAARGESVRWGASVDVKARLAPEPEGHVGTNGSAHGALALVGLRFTAMSPVVVAVNVAAAEVSPRLLLFHHLLAVDAGKRQGVQPHGALGSCGVDLLPESLNVLLGRGVEQAVCRSPQECSATQINERTILQDVGFIFYLQGKHRSRK